MEVVLISDPDRYGYSANSPEFNTWVDTQRSYIMSLPLEVRGSIVVWDRRPSRFMGSSGDRLTKLLDLALQGAPPLPMDLMVFKGLRDISFLPTDIEKSIGQTYSYESFYATTVQRSYAGKFLEIRGITHEPYIMNIMARAGTKCLYVQAYGDNVGELLLARDCQIHVLDATRTSDGVFLTCETMICSPPQVPGVIPINDDDLLSNTARKEMLEETGIQIRPRPLIIYVDVPLWQQLPLSRRSAAARNPLGPYVLQYPISQSWGAGGAGLMIACVEDGTFFALRRSPTQRSFPGFWSFPGGGTAEGYVHPVKAHYIYRVFRITITKKDKDLINGNLRLNPENDSYAWIPLSMVSEHPELPFSSYAFPDSLSRDRIPSSIRRMEWDGSLFHPGMTYALEHF